SGFRYSDSWGAATSFGLDCRTRATHARGVPYVLMPQAFGPFKDPSGRAAFKRAAERASLIFARDPESYGHVMAVVEDETRVHLVPDFTIDLPGQLPPDWCEPKPSDRRLVGIVPNSRMLDKTDSSVRSAYVDFMKRIV